MIKTKKIKDFDNYFIEENGEVLNIKTGNKLKGSISEGGYVYFRLSVNGKKFLRYQHRLVAETFLPNPKNLPVVNHIDGDKRNNNVSNLEWCSYSENTIHAYYNKGLLTKKRHIEYYKEDIEGEKWLKVKGYNNRYSVSSKGRVRNDRTLRLLQPSLTGGYWKVTLSEDRNLKGVFIHNLVYNTFIEETDNKNTVVNHINGNKLDNQLENLERISLSQNVFHSLYINKTNFSSKEVYQYNLEGDFLNNYRSTKEVERILKLDSSSVAKCCRGILKTCGGYIFRYKKNDQSKKLNDYPKA